VLEALRTARQQNGKQSPHNFLATLLPRRLAKEIADTSDYAGTLAARRKKNCESWQRK